ncbi:hypothetical protein CJ030_MR6G001829 [Morella rubra]|uniref:Uncharacterized protein n=1 Tax=Morella rubra TaxID=262757 RepID=A0A6A1VA43_9ROSI|nr:hypothetical protein CJ030_MR6G001829 [Morella rubra]
MKTKPSKIFKLAKQKPIPVNTTRFVDALAQEIFTKHFHERNVNVERKIALGALHHTSIPAIFRYRELYKKNYTNKDGIWTSEGAREIYHQLAKARDEIEAMRAAREKDLQEFAKKQAEMEATLRDHREEQRVEQERIRLEQEERMKREQERMRVEHEERMQRNKSACERSKSAYGQKYRRNWRRKCPL